jgi:hypothetical protein
MNKLNVFDVLSVVTVTVTVTVTVAVASIFAAIMVTSAVFAQDNVTIGMDNSTDMAMTDNSTMQ